MQQLDLTTLLAELRDSLKTTQEIENTSALQEKIAPLLGTILQNSLISQVPVTTAGKSSTLQQDIRKIDDPKLTFPYDQARGQSPYIFQSLRSKPAENPVGQDNLNLQEFISVFLFTDTTTPVLLLPVTINLVPVIIPPPKNTSFQISAGSVWILSKVLCSSAPVNTYTGLTVGGGTISFNELLPLNNKSITMPAGAVCTVQLNLQQPVDTTVSPDNIGIDAMNAKVQLPAHFNFTFSTAGVNIINIADTSWQVYGSANTFHYDTGQTAIYNPVLKSIFIGFKVNEPTFKVSQCRSSFFLIQGNSPILSAYWQLPVATIDITKINKAVGTGALAIVCHGGLQVNWINLTAGFVDLILPVISASPGMISISDQFAGNRYATQHYNLWSNEKTGRLSTLDISYANLFALYYISIQDGEESLNTTVQFIASIDRPVLVDGSPVDIQGTNGLLYQVYTPTDKVLLLYDGNLIAENYTPPGGGTVTVVPQEAMALTNALLTITPVSGIVLFGHLAGADTFENALLAVSFGMYYLLPSLPDPYASTYGFTLGNGNIAGIPDGTITKTLPLSDVKSLLLGMVGWPAIATNPLAPQTANLSFAIIPLGNNTTLGNQQIDSSGTTAAGQMLSKIVTAGALPARSAAQPTDSAGPDPWGDATGKFSTYGLAMLDVSTNADLMGVSFSTMNIQVESNGNVYFITPVDNSDETDFLQILGMDLATPGKFIRAFMAPEITWEPTFNLTPPATKSGDPDPPLGFLLFGDDGGPTQLFNNSTDVVPIAPIPVSNFIVDTYKNNVSTPGPLVTASLLTLPFGMRSMALLYNNGLFPAGYVPSALEISPQNFDITPTGVNNPPPKIVTGGLQIIAKGQQDPTIKSGSSFMGFTIQLRNLLDASGTVTNTSMLGPDVDIIFNDQFGPPIVHKVGVPVERIDFSGYGASMFSNWQDPTASIAATSQAKFDVFIGRTSLEIVQVKSLVYPWGIRVVRTVTMYRAGSAIIYRVDSGWRAETNGVYDFSYNDAAGTPVNNPYVFYPGAVKGVFDVKNIIENDLQVFNVKWVRNPGETYIDPETQLLSTVPAGGVTETVTLQPVYFDAEVKIDNVIQGAANGKVPSKKMVGYVQLSPRGEPISPRLFSDLLGTQGGSLSGPVDCIINIGNSGQQMRLQEVDVSNSVDTSGNPVFTGTARGTVILPKDGSWSIVQHSQATDAVSPIDNNASVPLIRRGQLLADGSSDYPAEQLRLADPWDLLKVPDTSTINIGLLQNTGTQKVLFQLPAYLENVTQLLSKDNNFPLAKFADAYHLVNSTGIFPNPGDIPDMDLSKFAVNISDQGYKLLNNTNPGDILKQALPSPWYFVNTKDVKIYIEYNANDSGGNPTPNLNYDLDSAAETWLSSAKNITLNVDLGPFTKIVYITGNFDSSNGVATAYNLPQLQFGPDLKPIVDILQVLESLSGGDYEEVAKKALDIAMSNSGDNFEYKFHADKEIPTIQFPPGYLDGPTTPLRLTAGLKVGAYFNEALSITSDPSNLVPSAGAYFEFDGSIQVMCVSLAAATVYAVGQVALQLSADVKTGPSLYMKFGFGVELMVGLPVVGNVSVTFMVGIEMTLSSTEIKITAFLLFKGEADLLGGIVDITITIEASGTVDRTLGPSAHTDMTAQVTFAIDISIFLVIDINFSKSWSESRQIA